jgi:hypothetical protein
MGLSDDDIRALTEAWAETMGAVQRAIVAHGGYTWSLIPGQENANASPKKMTHATCAQMLREACRAHSSWQRFSTLFGLANQASALTQLEQVSLGGGDCLGGMWSV